jgi:hypothetical protein
VLWPVAVLVGVLVLLLLPAIAVYRRRERAAALIPAAQGR